MNKKRDDFSPETKRKIGYRSGFRCCFPNCNRLLIEKSDNSQGYNNLGEYCHITAAAPGGPRYDESLSKEERESYDNGLLMCRNHANIIDKNEAKYPVSLLKQWKKEQEERIEKECESEDIFDRTSVELDSIFGALFGNGEYIELKKQLDKYVTSYGDSIDEEVLRWNILCSLVLDYECSCDIIKYISHDYDVFKLVIELMTFNERNYLELILNTTEDESLKQVISTFLLSTPQDILKNEIINEYFKKQISATNHYALHFLFKDKNACIVLDDKNNEITFNDDSFLYQMMVQTIVLKKKLLYNLEVKEQLNFAKLWLISHISLINKIRKDYRIICLSTLTHFLAFFDSDGFSFVYNQLNDQDKNDNSIIESYFLHKISNNKEIDVSKLIALSRELNDYRCLSTYIFGLENRDAFSILKDNAFLLKESSTLLLKYIDASDEDKRVVLNRYKDNYDDLTISALLWRFDIDPEKNREKCFSLETDLSNGLSSFNTYFYLITLIEKEEYDRFFDLSLNINAPSLQIANAAFYLQNKLLKDTKYDERFIELYNSLLGRGETFINLKYYLALIYLKKEKYSISEKLLEEEYNEFCNNGAIYTLAALRLNQQDFKKDYVFATSVNIPRFVNQLYVAETYLKDGDIDNALNYFERSIVCNNKEVHPKFRILEFSGKKIKKPNCIQDGTAVIVQNENKKIVLLFHEKSILDGLQRINDNDLCLNDVENSPFYFKTQGEEIVYSGKTYKITDIKNIYGYYSEEAMKSIINDKNTITIKGSSPQEAADNLKNMFMEFDRKHKDNLKRYDSFGSVFPISVSHNFFFGSDLFKNLTYLYANKQLIIPFTNHSILKKYEKIYFYYDSIFYLFKIYQTNQFAISENWVIPKLIYLDIVNECDKKIYDIKNSQEYLSIKDGKTTVLKYGKEDGAKLLTWYLSFKRFINLFKIETGDSFDFKCFNLDLKQWDGNVKSEKELFDLLSKTDSLIVSDSAFVQNVATIIKKQYLGTIDFLLNFSMINYIQIALDILNNKKRE